MTTTPDAEQLVAVQDTLYQSSNPTRRWLHCARRDWILDRIAALPHRVSHALEVGPGSGVYLPTLAQVAAEVTAADIEDAYLERARALQAQLPTLQVQRDDITASTLPAANYDLLLCTEVIEHIHDSQAALLGLARALSPDGTLILSTPYRYSPLELCGHVAFHPWVLPLVRALYREPVLETGHINLLSERECRRQIAAAGLQIVDSGSTGFYLPVLAELGSHPGQKLLQWLTGHMDGTMFRGLLWTQLYVLRKAG